MNRNLGLCYTICWKFRASQINPFSYHYTLNKPLKNRKKVIINFRESRIENSHSNTKASLFYGNITIGIISGEWGSIIMLAGPTSPTYRGSTVYVYIYIYIYICNELIEETARRRKLIFGMWEYFSYGSSKF